MGRPKGSKNRKTADTSPFVISVEDNLKLLHLQYKAKKSAQVSMEYGMNEGIQIMYQRIYALNPQSYGGRIEKYLCYRLGYKKVKSGDGDVIDPQGRVYELKGSMTDSTTFNIVQVREHHKLYGYIFAFIQLLPDQNFKVIEHIFCIPVSDFKVIAENMGLAHGTAKHTENNANIEKRKTMKIGDNFWNRLQPFRIEVKDLT